MRHLLIFVLNAQTAYDNFDLVEVNRLIFEFTDFLKDFYIEFAKKRLYDSDPASE